MFVNDQKEFQDALSIFSLALSMKSPCLGSGEGGVNMGADTGVCEVPGERQRLLRLAAGTYNIEGLNLVPRVSVEGVSEEETVIEGTVLGLRTGAVLSHVTVTAGTPGGMRVPCGRDRRQVPPEPNDDLVAGRPLKCS